MEKAYQDIIRDIAQELLKRLEFEASVEVLPDKDDLDTVVCMVTLDANQNLLIGQHGINLLALQHLIRILLRKQIKEPFNVIVDINGYFAERKRSLEQEADRAFQEVLRDHVTVTLRPMAPYERKVVHAFLSLNKAVKTESVGKGSERRVRISPKPSEV